MTEPTWSWIELIWTVANVLGALGNARLVVLAVEKRAAVLRVGWKPDGPRVTVGNRYIRNDLGRLCCHLIGVTIGIYALLVTTGDPVLNALVAWGLVAIMAILAALAIFDLLDERRMDHLVARELELERDDG